MAAEFDEYAYLEQQVTAPPAGDAAPEPAPSTQKDEHKEKSRSSDKDKDRERDRDRDRSKKSRDRSRDRDRERSSRKSRHRSRSRSRSRSRRHRSRSRSRDRRHHRRSRSPPRRRERTPPEVRIAREKERELRELERATRTIFCYQLNLRAEEKDLFDFFSKVGTVTDIKLISDRHTRKSKGMAYIEFRNQEDAFKAVALNGVANFMNLPLCVKSAEAEKNLAWEVQQQAKQTQATLQQVATTGPCKLQILNLNAELTDADVKPLFEPFGPVLSVQIIRDAAGNSMRYGYVTFQTTTDGERAAQHWNGQVVRDLVIAVSVANHLDVAAAAASHLSADTDGDENLKLSAQARAHLMSRLAASAGLQQPKQPTTPDGGIAGAMPQLGGLVPAAGAVAAPPPAVDAEVLLEQGLLGPASPIPTQCLLLKNMFDPQELQDPAAEAEVTQDVVEECGKFGRVLHCFVDKNSKGFVYLKFEAVEGAQAAAQALHGRWYSGHQIVAEYQFMQIYAAYFKV